MKAKRAKGGNAHSHTAKNSQIAMQNVIEAEIHRATDSSFSCYCFSIGQNLVSTVSEIFLSAIIFVVTVIEQQPHTHMHSHEGKKFTFSSLTELHSANTALSTLPEKNLHH